MTRCMLKDCRPAGVCKDVKGWFRKHGLDFHAFVNEGVSPEVLRGTNDAGPAVERVIRAAEEREAREAKDGR